MYNRHIALMTIIFIGEEEVLLFTSITPYRLIKTSNGSTTKSPCPSETTWLVLTTWQTDLLKDTLGCKWILKPKEEYCSLFGAHTKQTILLPFHLNLKSPWTKKEAMCTVVNLEMKERVDKVILCIHGRREVLTSFLPKPVLPWIIQQIIRHTFLVQKKINGCSLLHSTDLKQVPT